jgi:rhodanese-related sulfurtransferase
MKAISLFIALACLAPVLAEEVGQKKSAAEAAPDFSFPERPAYYNFKPDRFDLLRTRNTNSVVLDVRTAGEFAQGHIPGAALIDFKAPDFKAQVARLDRNKIYLVHCAAGGRSVKAVEVMHELGFERLFNLDGGMKAWEAAGKPVEKTGSPRPAPLAPVENGGTAK